MDSIVLPLIALCVIIGVVIVILLIFYKSQRPFEGKKIEGAREVQLRFLLNLEPGEKQGPLVSVTGRVDSPPHGYPHYFSFRLVEGSTVIAVVFWGGNAAGISCAPIKVGDTIRLWGRVKKNTIPISLNGSDNFFHAVKMDILKTG